MLRRPLRSAAVASSLLAANLVVLTLYLNPDLTLRDEVRALFLCLFLPYLLLGMAALPVLPPAAALVIPLAMRPAPRPAAPVQPVSIDQVTPVRRVTLIGIDGLSPAFVQDGVARGNLPALARLLRRGASGALATLR